MKLVEDKTINFGEKGFEYIYKKYISLHRHEDRKQFFIYFGSFFVGLFGILAFLYDKLLAKNSLIIIGIIVLVLFFPVYFFGIKEPREPIPII